MIIILKICSVFAALTETVSYHPLTTIILTHKAYDKEMF